MKTIQNEFENHEQQIRIYAQQLSEIIRKMRNMCTSDANILRYIKLMREKLSDALKNVNDFDAKVRQTSVHAIGYSSRLERKMNELNQNYYNQEQQQKILKQKLKTEEEELRKLTNQKRSLESELSNMENTHNSQCLWMLFTFGLAAIPIGIYRASTNFDGRMARILNSISQWQSKISNLQDEIRRCYQEILQKDDEIHQCQRKKQQAEEDLLQLRKIRSTIDSWLEALNGWLNYLMTMEPQVERVVQNIGYNENALRNAIQDLKNDVNNNSTYLLEAEANKLAITYT